MQGGAYVSQLRGKLQGVARRASRIPQHSKAVLAASRCIPATSLANPLAFNAQRAHLATSSESSDAGAVRDIAALLGAGKGRQAPPSRARAAALLNSLAAVPWHSPGAGTLRYLMHPAACAVASALPRRALLGLLPALTPPATVNLLRALPQEAAATIAQGLMDVPGAVLRASPAVLFWGVLRALETDDQALARGLLQRWKGGEGGVDVHPLPWDAVRLLFTHRAVRGDFNALHILQDYVSSRPREALCHRSRLLGRTLNALTHELAVTPPVAGLRQSDWSKLSLELMKLQGTSKTPPSLGKLGPLREPPGVRSVPINVLQCSNSLSQHAAQLMAATEVLFQAAAGDAIADGVAPSDPPSLVIPGAPLDASSQGSIARDSSSPTFHRVYQQWHDRLGALVPSAAATARAQLKGAPVCTDPPERDALFWTAVGAGDELAEEHLHFAQVAGRLTATPHGREEAPPCVAATPPLHHAGEADQVWIGHGYLPSTASAAPAGAGAVTSKPTRRQGVWSQVGGTSHCDMLRVLRELADVGLHQQAAFLLQACVRRVAAAASTHGVQGGLAVGEAPLQEALAPHHLEVWRAEIADSVATLQGLGAPGTAQGVSTGGRADAAAPPAAWMQLVTPVTAQLAEQLKAYSPTLRRAIDQGVPGTAGSALKLAQVLAAANAADAAVDLLRVMCSAQREAEEAASQHAATALAAGLVPSGRRRHVEGGAWAEGDPFSRRGGAAKPPTDLQRLLSSLEQSSGNMKSASLGAAAAAASASATSRQCCVAGGASGYPCAPQCVAAAAAGSMSGMGPLGCAAPHGWGNDAARNWVGRQDMGAPSLTSPEVASALASSRTPMGKNQEHYVLQWDVISARAGAAGTELTAGGLKQGTASGTSFHPFSRSAEHTGTVLSHALGHITHCIALPSEGGSFASAAPLHLPALLHSCALSAGTLAHPRGGGGSGCTMTAAGGSVSMNKLRVPPSTPAAVLAAGLMRVCRREAGSAAPVVLPEHPLWSVPFTSALVPPPCLHSSAEILAAADGCATVRPPVGGVLSCGIRAALQAGRRDIAMALLQSGGSLARTTPAGTRHLFPPIDDSALLALTYTALREGDWTAAYEAVSCSIAQNIPGGALKLHRGDAGMPGGREALGPRVGQGGSPLASMLHRAVPGLPRGDAGALSHFLLERLEEGMAAPGQRGASAQRLAGEVRSRLAARYGGAAVQACEGVLGMLADEHEEAAAARWRRGLAGSGMGDDLDLVEGGVGGGGHPRR